MFQKKIIEKYLSKIDRVLLAEKYTQFGSIFADKERQETIRSMKEEEYQELFLKDLFCSVLDYTIKPDSNYNIVTELKNETKNKNNARKADGAIIIGGTTKAVIELKGTNTQDLDTVAKQAFDYKSHHENCNYVIVSNFERLRLYVETQSDFEEFNLFNLSKESFDLLYLLLQIENITNDIPLKLKHETLTEEKEITNNFYADYSTFKRALFEDLCENNPDTDKLLLFKKTQKLLDRILFVLFCEDRNLLPANSTIGIINDYKKLKELGYYQPLYSVFKTFFDRIDKGFKHETDSSKNIFAYNGGLFKPDEILDSVKIGDDVLYIHSQRLANYDFQSQISVDILGRIFENSLTEIEEVQNEIENEKQGIKVENNNIGKRKKDGVFYTPEYITKYIVENTIGKLCDARKEELKIDDDEFSSDKKHQKKTIAELDKRLETYREYLLSLKILDPACGSGAFLNAALRYLRKEHTLIDYFWSKIHEGELNFTAIDNTILENNLYGVDINEDSIEITKLSLWLHTASKNRKLTTLNDKIKCGNSLIDDPNIAGEKAFDWQKEFPEVFEKGGFDVVIGNPPYVNINTQPAIHNYLLANYAEIHTGYNDLMYYFLYKSIKLLKFNGVMGMITSNYYIRNEYAKKLRLFLNKHTERIIDFRERMIFSDANVHTAIIFAKNTDVHTDFEIFSHIKENEEINLSSDFERCSIERNNLSDTWLIASEASNAIIEKMREKSVYLEDITFIEQGSKSGKNDVFTVSREFAKTSNFESELLRGNVKNGDIQSYIFADRGNVLIYTDNSTEIEKYPNIYSYLLGNKEILSSRNEVQKGCYSWFRFDRPRNKTIFDAKEKIIVPYRAEHNRFAYDNQQYFNDGGDIRAIVVKDEKSYSIKFLLAILNSSLLDWYYGFIGKTKGSLREYFNTPLAQIPISAISLDEQKPFIDLADKMLSLNSDLQKKTSNFLKVAKETFNIEKPSAKLETFYDLTFEEFIKELKQKITPKIKLEWLELFEEQKTALQKLKEEIAVTDSQINSLVYKLYGLSDEEIRIVEGQ